MQNQTHKEFSEYDNPLVCTPWPGTAVVKINLEREIFFPRLFLISSEILRAKDDFISIGSPLFEPDSSSLQSNLLKAKDETPQTTETTEDFGLSGDESLFKAMLDNDTSIKMPPIKKYKVRLKINKIEKATPNVIEFGEI